MPLINIGYGSLASSEVMNDNFNYLDNRVTTVANNLTTTSSSIYSNIASMNSTFTQKTENIEDEIDNLQTDLTALRNDFDSYSIMPDYAKAVTVNYSSGDRVGFNGWLQCESINGSASDAGFFAFIDGVRFCAMQSGSSSGIPDADANITLVSENSILTFSGSASHSFKRIPFVGGE